MEKVTASADCWNVLVVTGSAAEEVAELIILSAKSVCRLMRLEAAHTSDASFDPAMVLFKSIVQVDGPEMRPMPYRLLRSASPITGNSFASHRRMDSWLIVNPRNSMISLRSRSVSL